MSMSQDNPVRQDSVPPVEWSEKGRSSSPAQSMESSRRRRAGALSAKSIKELRKTSLLHNPAWRRVLVRYLETVRKDLSIRSVYAGLGWTESRAYWARRRDNIDLRSAGQMARIVWPKDPGKFLWDICKEMALPPIGQRIVDSRRVEAAAKVKSDRSPRCSRCGTRGHNKNSRKCPLRAGNTTDFLLMKHRASSSGVKRKHKKERR